MEGAADVEAVAGRGVRAVAVLGRNTACRQVMPPLVDAEEVAGRGSGRVRGGRGATAVHADTVCGVESRGEAAGGVEQSGANEWFVSSAASLAASSSASSAQPLSSTACFVSPPDSANMTRLAASVCCTPLSHIERASDADTAATSTMYGSDALSSLSQPLLSLSARVALTESLGLCEVTASSSESLALERNSGRIVRVMVDSGRDRCTCGATLHTLH